MSVTTLAIPRSPSHPAFGILPAARAGRLMRFNASSESPVPPPLRPEYYNRLAHDVLFDWIFACPVWGDVSDYARDPSLTKSPGLRHPACGAYRALDALQRIKRKPRPAPNCAPSTTTDLPMMFSLIEFLRAPFGAMSITRIALRCLPRYPACLSALKGLLHREILDWIVACPAWSYVSGSISMQPGR